MHEGLVDDIYECAFLPELWPSVLERLADVADARGGCFVAGDRTTLTHWTASPGIEAAVAATFTRGLINKSERRARVLGARHAGFLRDNDLYTDEEFAQDILYRDFLWPGGFGFAVGTAFSMPTDETLIISFERERAKGPAAMTIVARLDALRPHIARSAYLSARQQMVRARDTAAVLERIGLPAIVLTDVGKVLVANDLADRLKALLVWRANDRLALKDRNADELFRQAIATIGMDADAPVRSFVVRDAHCASTAVAHVLPLRNSAGDLFVRCAAVLVLTPVAMLQAPPIELVQSLFDLTPAEARVARGIAVGETVQEIARGGGVTANTVRSQLRWVLEKTGCRRQAEVASLLGGLRSLA